MVLLFISRHYLLLLLLLLVLALLAVRDRVLIFLANFVGTNIYSHI